MHSWLLTGGPTATQYQSLIKPCTRQPEHMHNHPKTASSQPLKRSAPRKPTEKSTVDTIYLVNTMVGVTARLVSVAVKGHDLDDHVAEGE